MFQTFHRTLRTAVHALRRNVTRSMLTCIGIVIGIAAVIAMIEIGQGSSYLVQQTIASIGANVIQIDPSDVVKASVSTGRGGQVTLTPADCQAILHECTAVRCAAPSLDARGQVIYGNRNWSPNDIRGTTPDYLVVSNWTEMAEGEAFNEADVARAAPVCLLGRTVARALFDDNSPIGKQVRIKNINMTVIGVLKPRGASMTGRDQDDYVVAPWTTVKFRLSGSRQATTPAAASASAGKPSELYPGQPPQLYPLQCSAQIADLPMLTRFIDLDDIFVSATSAQEVPLAMRQITALLRQRHRIEDGGENDFRIRDLTEIAQNMAATGRVMTTLLICVAAISLTVGGVGIMNIMLVSVTERTREIGLRMAVGARGEDILRQFLLEAFLLCMAGGVAGILLGRATSVVVSGLLRWPTLASLPAILAAVGVSAAVGLLFGFYPAWKASRLNPIEALRYE